jgi:hypothetical protein
VHSPLSIACQKALDKLNKYYTEYLEHGYSSILMICDLCFNFNVFNIVLESSREGNAKKARIKSHFKTCFYQY